MRSDKELLEDALFLIESGSRGGQAYDITEEIRARLAEPEDEPVLWADTDDDGELAWDVDKMVSDDPAWLDNPIPLYRHPPRQIVRLSDDEIEDICWTEVDRRLLSFARAIESKSLEKNK